MEQQERIDRVIRIQAEVSFLQKEIENKMSEIADVLKDCDHSGVPSSVFYYFGTRRICCGLCGFLIEESPVSEMSYPKHPYDRDFSEEEH